MIRRATPQDTDAIAAVEAAAAEHPWSTEQVRSTLRTASTWAWLAGQPAHAHLLTCMSGVSADILTVAVDPKHRRQGIAAALIRHALTAWRQAGVFDVFLEVRTDNIGARALYQHLGFEQVGIRPRYYSDGCDALVLKREV